MNKKAISPVVAITLLIVVSVVAVIGYQSWYTGYQSILLSNAESSSSNKIGKVNIEYISNDGFIYVSNTNTINQTMNTIKIGDINCNINQELTPGITSIDISSCLNETGNNDIIIVTDSGIIEKEIFIEKEIVSQSNPIPSLSFSVNQSLLAYNDDILLTWSASNLDNCIAQGDWSGSLDLSNTTTLSNVKSNSTYTINCTGINGNLSQSLNVNITSYPSCISLRTGLVGLWHLDNSGTDNSVNSNTGSNYGNAGYNTNRKIGSHSLYVDGNGDYMQIPRSVTLEPTTQISYGGWINTVSIPGAYASVVDKLDFGSPTWPGYHTRAHPSGGKYNIVAGIDFNGGINTGFGGYILDYNQWYHFIATYNGSKIKTYINGNEVGTRDQTGNIVHDTNTPLRFGARTESASDYINAYFDEIAIYSVGLSAEEVKDLYTLGDIGIPICDS